MKEERGIAPTLRRIRDYYAMKLESVEPWETNEAAKRLIVHEGHMQFILAKIIDDQYDSCFYEFDEYPRRH